MYSKITIARHPIHPMLVGFPVTCYTGTLVGFTVYAANGNKSRANLAIALNIAGSGTALLAALPGIADLAFGIPRRSPAKAIGIARMAVSMSRRWASSARALPSTPRIGMARRRASLLDWRCPRPESPARSGPAWPGAGRWYRTTTSVSAPPSRKPIRVRRRTTPSTYIACLEGRSPDDTRTGASSRASATAPAPHQPAPAPAAPEAALEGGRAPVPRGGGPPGAACAKAAARRHLDHRTAAPLDALTEDNLVSPSPAVLRAVVVRLTVICTPTIGSMSAHPSEPHT